MFELAFEKKYSFKERFAESDRVLSKYSDRVPIIVEKDPNSNIEDINKHKFLVPKNLTVGQFVYVIRKNIKLTPDQAVFIFINGNVLPSSSDLIDTIYEKHKSPCNFLFMIYSGENVFG